MTNYKTGLLNEFEINDLLYAILNKNRAVTSVLEENKPIKAYEYSKEINQMLLKIVEDSNKRLSKKRIR